MKEDERLKQEVSNLKGEINTLKDQHTINEKFKESNKTQDSEILDA